MRGSRYRGERISRAQARARGRALDLTGTPRRCSHRLPARSLSERHRGWVGSDSNIGRSPHTPGGRSKGGQGLSILSGLAPWASRLPGRGARPSLRSPCVVAAEPRHAACWHPAPAPRRGAILVAESTSPMSQAALTVGTVPARRPGRPVARRCSSIKSIPGTLLRPCDGTRDCRANSSHHPATAATATSRSAPRPPNHSGMAAFARPTHSCRGVGGCSILARWARVSAIAPNLRGSAEHHHVADNAHRKAAQ